MYLHVYHPGIYTESLRIITVTTAIGCRGYGALTWVLSNFDVGFITTGADPVRGRSRIIFD